MNESFTMFVNGFIGGSSVKMQDIVSTTAIGATGNTSGNERWLKSTGHVANKDVIENYVRMLQYPTQYLDFDWREKVLKDTIAAFGSRYLDPWLGGNYLAGMLTDTRKDFLDDCIRFIRTGKRIHPINMWQTYIGFADEKVGAISTFSDEVQILTCCSDTRQGLEGTKICLAEILQAWLSHPTGMRDLITTAMVLWGDDTIK